MNERNKAATELGLSHAEAQDHGEPIPRIYSGRQVAEALGISEELTGDEYVALHGAYQRGRSDYW